jgi:hypothetical protein
MTESPLPQYASADQHDPHVGSWDVGALASALDKPPDPTVDLALGDGVAFHLGPPDRQTLLEVFPTGPRAPVVRLTAPDLQVSLFRQVDPPRIVPEGLVFELAASPNRRWLSLGPTGETTLFYDPERAEAPQESRNPQKGPHPLPVPETAATGDPEGQEAYQRPLPEARQEKQPRVTYSGRLGTDPRCRITPRDILVCSFPVAEKQEGSEKPTWRTTVAFRELAGKVQETLKKGMFVDVIGYEHERTRKARDGSVRHDLEVYAVAIRQR